MNRQSELLKNIDWLSIFLYTLLVFMGWLNIYAAVYDESHSNILDIDLKYGKQLLWIGAAFTPGYRPGTGYTPSESVLRHCSNQPGCVLLSLVKGGKEHKSYSARV